MKKKIISVLAVVAMLVFACGTAFSAEFSIDLKGIKDTIKKDVKNAKSGSTTGTAKAAAANTEPNSEDDFDWKVNDDFTEITITKYKGTRKDVVIPATIQDVPVVCIGYNAFSCTGITSVVIPEGIKEIEYGAFSYNNIQSIEIPKGCTLKKCAFSTCSELESVTLPEGLKVIPDRCFEDCTSLANIDFPSTLKFIGFEAFKGCPFTSVDLPEGVEYIGWNVFISNTITSVSLPKSLKWVYYYNANSPNIKSDNISTITIAEGCAPKAIGGKEGMDGRDIIKGASIDKSLKLQKQLAAWKLTQYEYKKDKDALKKDLMSYGFTEEEAKDKL
ncbi:MAG: leucine-rich repeat protein [Spirochaetaceae bacterium]|nr:leucine-rich repeat protein [Spirochaetaceae bacterium]